MSEIPPQVESPVLGPLPWERPGAGPGELGPTWTRLIASPAASFRALTVTRGFGRALVFGLLCYFVGNVVAQVWGLVMEAPLQRMLEQFGGPAFARQEAAALSPAIRFAVGVIVGPMVWIVFLFLWSGIVHGLLLLFGGAPKGFETSLRVIAYSAAPSVFAAVPFLGGLVGSVWGIVLQCIGLAEAHGVPRGRAVAAVLVPLAVCCVCLAVLAFVFSAAIAAAMGTMAR